MTTLDRRSFLVGAGMATAGLLLPPARSAAATPVARTALTGLAVSSSPFGVPPAGNMYYGCSVPGGDPTTFEAALGRTVGTYRSYFQASQVAAMRTRAARDLAAGRLPVLSTKLPGPWAAVAAGRHDAWIDSLCANLDSVAGPVHLSLHHEPENDVDVSAGMGSADFRAMYARFLKRKNAITNHVALVPILMSGLYNPTSTSHPLRLTDWLSDGMADVFSFDGYNHWSPGGTKKWKTVEDTFGHMVTDMHALDPSKPIVIAEYGVRVDPSRPGRARYWMVHAYDWCAVNGVIAMSFFNSNQNVNDGGTPWSIQLPPARDERFGAFRDLLARTTSCRVAV